MSKNERKYPKGYWMGVGISIGVAIGVALGPFFDNIGVGIAIGTSLEQKNKDNIRPLTEQEQKRQKLGVVTGHAAPIVIGNSSSNGMYQVTMDFDHTVKVWETRTGVELASFFTDQIPVIAGIAIDSNGNHVALTGNDGTVIMRDIVSGHEIRVSIEYVNDISGATFSPDGTRHAISGRDGKVKVLEVGTGLELLSLTGHTLPV